MKYERFDIEGHGDQLLVTVTARHAGEVLSDTFDKVTVAGLEVNPGHTHSVRLDASTERYDINILDRRDETVLRIEVKGSGFSLPVEGV